MGGKPKLRSVAPDELPRKPMARATRVRLYEREVREKLSGPAVEILLDRAQLLAEGARSRSPTAGQAFFGSIMMTIDLAQVAEAVCERCDEATAARLADMMSSDARVLLTYERVFGRTFTFGSTKRTATDTRLTVPLTDRAQLGEVARSRPIRVRVVYQRATTVSPILPGLEHPPRPRIEDEITLSDAILPP